MKLIHSSTSYVIGMDDEVIDTAQGTWYQALPAVVSAGGGITIVLDTNPIENRITCVRYQGDTTWYVYDDNQKIVEADPEVYKFLIRLGLALDSMKGEPIQ